MTRPMMAKNIRMKISSMARIERPPGLSRVPSAVPDVPSERPAALQPYNPTALQPYSPAARVGDADPRSSERRRRSPQPTGR